MQKLRSCSCPNVEKYTSSEILEAETINIEKDYEDLVDLLKK